MFGAAGAARAALAALAAGAAAFFLLLAGALGAKAAKEFIAFSRKPSIYNMTCENNAEKAEAKSDSWFIRLCNFKNVNNTFL